MESPVVNSEPSASSQKRRLTIRKQPRSQRRQHFRPLGQEPEKLDKNSTPHSRVFNADHRSNNKYPSPLVEISSDLGAPDKNDMRRLNVDNLTHVASTSRSTPRGVAHVDVNEARGVGGSVITKSHASVRVSGEEEEIVPRGVLHKIQRTKTETIRTISAALPRFRRRHRTMDEPVMSASVIRPPVTGSAGGGRPQSENAQREEKQVSATILPAQETTGESEEIEQLRRDLAESRSQVAELQMRCEAQTRDLEGSNGFLNTADKPSDSDVIRALQRLNAEVQQNTTYMADCLAEDLEFENLTKNATREQTSAAQRVSRRIGEVLADFLGRNTPEDVAMLLQIAFQAYLTSVFCQSASCWAFEPVHNKFIKSIYHSLRVGEEPSTSMHPSSRLTSKAAESQALSGRWRSLTRVHIHNHWTTHPESFVRGILTEISDITLAAGCTAPPSDIITKITSKFQEKITLLVDLVRRFCKMFNEVISCDFEVFIAMPGEKYNLETMEDADDDQPRIEMDSGEALVLCATHIGLTKRVPVGTLWEKGKKQKIMVLKAKVLLGSFLTMELEH